ncbi:alpha-hydroxy acid oxidase [Acidimangrovimonas sediminis]|uniref:alpha-hydroxy acid oxidase n=1 Tax=Acidimangrovimonas sediminis TaxID=2056283 RepID=UPI0018EB853C|nr:alpha-hydroxy acid oxidase [Acidimangrovimonas sediminis]
MGPAACLSFDMARRAARRRLPRGLFDYVDRGVGQEAALLRLRESLDAVEIAPRVLVSRTDRDIGCTLFGWQARAPLVIAPTAMAGLVHPDGEIVLARAAARAGIPVALSTQSITSVGRLRAAVPEAEIWMQLYLWQDLDQSDALIARAAEAGVRVLVMTVDTPYGARKEWVLRSGFSMPFRPGLRSATDMALHPGWLWRVALRQLLRDGLPKMENYPAGRQPRLVGGPPAPPELALRRDLGWDDVARVRDRWPGVLILKGILRDDDALSAADLGVDGVVVSSHGARNLDAAPAPVTVLPGIAEAVAGRMTVLADSGVRRGLDVLRYRLAGAEAVMLGRLPLWALAAGGAAGVEAALDWLTAEYREALDFSGAAPGAPPATSAAE